MGFYEVLDQVLELLQHRGRVTYRALKREFNVDDEFIADLKMEIIKGQRLAVDEDGEVLVWIGEVETIPPSPSTQQPPSQEAQPLHSVSPSTAPHTLEAERRQLTVLFCDLVDSTKLAGQLDPEDLREVIRTYQHTCAKVIQRFEGYIAQYLGDGLLVYFGYPQAHEDDAQRAVRTGLGMLEAIGTLNTRLEQDKGIRLAVRVGIHTGLVVVGEMGDGRRQEQLALGETPNIAARIQGLAHPDTVVISDATSRLVQGYVVTEDRGSHALKGVATPQQLYRVVQDRGIQSRLEIVSPRGLTPLVGRESELTLLLDRWEEVKKGRGQVVLLSGEAGIGKSRLVKAVKDQLVDDPHSQAEIRCSPYHQQSALYPLIDLFQRALQFQREDTAAEKLRKLEELLGQYGLALPEMVPLFGALLSIPLPDHYPSLTLSPQQQRQKTLEALLALRLAIAAQQPVLYIVEDLHWADPSTLEWLGLLLEQVPMSRILVLLTCRPEFHPPWNLHLTQLTLSRFDQGQVEVMVRKITGEKNLPPEVLQQIVVKTDGVPLFVEEVTKMVLESGMLTERDGQYALTETWPVLAIPTTLQDSLMARLDRLNTAKGICQLGAVMGRQFAYEVIQALSPVDEPTLQRELHRLVEAELLYQRGVPPQATYLFKHALIQEAAYQALLKSTRQQYHQQIAQVLEQQFPETAHAQPELLAHHYTEASCHNQAVDYWQRAGQQAVQHSANQEAIVHLTKGLELLATLPDSIDHTQQELDFLMTLAPAFVATKGQAAPEVQETYDRARALCQQVEATPQLFQVLYGLWRFYLGRGALATAREFAEQLLLLAQHIPDSAFLIKAHGALGVALFHCGELLAARAHLEQALALYEPYQHRFHPVFDVFALRISPLYYTSWTLWFLGYGDQSLEKSREAWRLSQELDHPYSLVSALFYASVGHLLHGEVYTAQERAETAMALATEQGFTQRLAQVRALWGYALAAQGHGSEGIAQMCQALTVFRTTGAQHGLTDNLFWLAEAYGRNGQVEEGLRVLAEALALVDNTGEYIWEAELHRLKGELLLQSRVRCPVSGVSASYPALRTPDLEAESETCFHQTLTIARHQQAKLWELRAAMSLSRLWQQQGKRNEARELLAPLYQWFTEGFDTKDLQEAKALLEELA